MSTSASSPARYEPTGVPTGRVALWWFLASEMAIFGGLIVTYVLNRVAHPEWGEAAAHTVTELGALNTFILLTSSLTAVLGHDLAHRGDGPGAARMLRVTVGLAALFLVVKGFEYAHEIGHGFTPVASAFWAFYFFMTGLHALHVVAGMVALLVIARGAAAGRALGRVELGAMYWHLIDVIWIFLFPLLYLAS